jgi:hypothetical protein
MVASMVVAFTTILPPSRLVAQDDQSKEDTKSESRDFGIRGLLLRKLRLYDPVYAFGPYPFLLYTANVGDLVQLQVSYPISPPFPKSITVTYSPRYFRVVDIVETDGKVVTVPPTKEGVLGVGYYSIFLKPIRAGNTYVSVTLTFENGDTAEVPFNFRIGNERKAVAAKPKP